MSFLVVGTGGAIGACCRYLLTRLFEQQGVSFPLGTLLSNIIAALLIGFIIGIERQSSALPQNMKLFLTTGLLGGLSTFSTFSMETVRCFEDGRAALAAGNVLLNVGLSLVFVCVGLAAAKVIIRTN